MKHDVWGGIYRSLTDRIRPTLRIAILFAAAGEKERALEWLERDNQDCDRFLWLLYPRLEFDPI
jgi:hypothetical protein